jgi:2-keto-4-pentenoate hydratase/2-oxohepta-3-ene-1,7-dioic acid hydratase in catechol pathway
LKYGRFERNGRAFFGTTDNATIPDLKHGDVVEILQKHIGVLRNPVVKVGA